MTRFSILTRSTAVALCLPGTAALADLTSADVWSDWKAYMGSAGYDITASEASDGGTLKVSDLTMSIDLGENAEDGAATITMESLQFVEQGDGSVSIELPAQTSIDVTM
ncbi:MAG: DUF2125 domain-containing protein, partial [Pseudomonadota bacterium]